jgi:hypothetical protein
MTPSVYPNHRLLVSVEDVDVHEDGMVRFESCRRGQHDLSMVKISDSICVSRYGEASYNIFVGSRPTG